jgi:predicted nucleic acid-binding protein
MIVVADSGPLHYLILLDHAELLHRFYDEVVVPDAVANELTSSSAPSAVREWISRAPPWLSVVPVKADQLQEVTGELDLGERAAIALAGVIHADLLLIDKAAGRAEARRRNLRVTGTLGVLRTAAERGLIDVPDLIVRLKATLRVVHPCGDDPSIPFGCTLRRGDFLPNSDQCLLTPPLISNP